MKTVKNNLGGMLGLAKKAGKTVAGTEQVNERVRRGQLCMVVIASDASENTKKRVINCCTTYGAGYTVAALTTVELAKAVGRVGAVSALGITDMSFTAALKRIIEQSNDSCKAGIISAGGAINDIKPEIQD